MGNWWLIGIAGILCLTAGCESKTASKQLDVGSSQSIPTQPVEAGAGQPQSLNEKALNEKDFFPAPLVAAGTNLQPVPVPNLIPTTTSVERIPQVDSGRPDPFASLGYAPAVVRVKSQQAAVKPAAPLPTVTVEPLPQTAVTQSPTIFPLPPLVPAANSLNTLPSISVPSPAMPMRSDAESIEISGVVQIGGKTNVIVKVPSEQTSRYVTVGERLANGNVLVKRVEMGLEPVVILEQGGREVVRSIGSSGALVGAM